MTTDASQDRAVHEQALDGFGTVRVRRLDPERDVDTIHSWVTQERARFWGMGEATREEVLEIYRHMDGLTTHHAWLIECEGRPVMLFQTYDPEADRVSECYATEPGDVGVHLMVGPPQGAPRPGFTAAMLSVLVVCVLADPSVRRIVAEPDIRNAKAVERLARTGFEIGPEIVLPEIDLPEVFLPEKRARLAILHRETAETRELI
ncbi:GNAT family N-acetyltransferase [Streptomyces sp. FIT100]|uniref:GNAT family N-acetyltransferase n=1 Tax=Streptomyces sp. FIT100 TaxID=2837956 RepID=UPI0021C5B580|nr:GNAT family N-acetyltransferase [Streptomyces sp. FIT100]UUN28998.1 GNAT family N-acetyltransferase [Streptomyces sp. FIT100]